MMSGRSRSAACADFFLNVKTAAVEETPDGAHTRFRAALRGKPPLHLYDGHVGRGFDQSEQEVTLRIKLAAPPRSLTARRSLAA
jgi:hypothetical protein